MPRRVSDTFYHYNPCFEDKDEDKKAEVDSTKPIVEINSGTVYGKLVKSPQGTDIEQYLGIPFAKPPIGDLRFSNPVPLSKFDGGNCPILSSALVVSCKDSSELSKIEVNIPHLMEVRAIYVELLIRRLI